MKKDGFLVFCSILIFAPASLAQGFGSMVGRVTDPTGAVVASVKVTATEHGTGLSRTATSDSQGLYVIPSLRPSSYDLTAEANGFSTWKQSGLTLLADQTLTVNIGLKLGATSEVVTVTSTQLQVDTSTATLKQVVEMQRLEELPLNGRNAAELTLQSSGAQTAPGGGADQGNTKTFPGAVTISANGSRGNQISYQLDGGNYVDEYTNVNQPFPFPDALQEFSVQTSNYSAQYGQNAGAVVNIVTKSGTNSFHGDVFEFVRNAVFNARNFFAPLSFQNQATKDMGRDQLKRNQFGGTVGGPIIHDKTFFFAGYQGTLLRNVGDPTTTSAPNAVQRATVTNPAILNVLKLMPVGVGGSPTTAGTVVFVRPNRQNFHDIVSRVDHSFSSKDRLTLRQDYNRFTHDAVFDPANILSYADGSTIVNQNYLLHESHVFNTHLLNDARFSFAREVATRGPAATVPNVNDFGVSVPYQPVKAIQSIRVGGGFTFGDNPPASFVRNNFSWSDDVSHLIGSHSLHYGGALERSRVDLNNRFFQPGEYTFVSMTNFLNGALSRSGGNNALRQGAGEFKNNRNTFAGLYLQDDWHIARRLTLNLGLRWEPFLPWHEIRGRSESFLLSQAHPGGQTSTVYVNAPPGLLFPGDPSVPQYGVRANYTNFAPRLGFAYDVSGTGKTSLRGGFGMFYDTRQVAIVNNRVVDDPPFSPQLIANEPNVGPFNDPLCMSTTPSPTVCNGGPIANIFPAPFPPPKNAGFPPPVLIHVYDPSSKFQTPVLYSWNLTFEHQLPSDFLVRLGYVGSHSSHIKESVNLDPALPGTTAFNDARRRLNLGLPSALYSDVFMDDQDINSAYHSLQASVERRVSKGVTVLASYTWSKSIDDLPVGGGVADIGADSPSTLPWDDPNRHAFDRGISDFDHRHRFAISYVWQLPALTNQSGLLRGLLGNWTFSGTGLAQSGSPFTATSGGVDQSHTGLGQDRAQLVAGQNAYGPGACAAGNVTTSCVDFLNVAAFVQPTSGTFGNASKDSLIGPDLLAWNMGLYKNFPFSERWHMQFRAEFFNVFNRANFNNPTNGRNNNRFGAITSAQDPRIGQLAIKIFF